MKYKISFGNGTAWLETHEVEADLDFEALDNLIDRLESDNRKDCFITQDDLVENGGEHYSDEYVTGGNHCLMLIHYGYLTINLIVEPEIREENA